MKNFKFCAFMMSALIILSGCGMSNTAKGGIIGGTGGAAVGALVGKLLIGKSNTAALVGAGVGAAVGTTAGVLIGKKMDKAKAAAEAVQNAKVESVDLDGNPAVKVSFDGGILFQQGKAALNANAQGSLRQFATSVLNVYNDCDVAILGFTNSDGSDATNLTLSNNRANAVKSYLTGNCGVNAAQIKNAKGYGEDPNYLIYGSDGQEDKAASRRVEVYLYPSQAMIDAANAGTLQ